MIKKFTEAYKGKNVLVTGNTGFKGSWLSFWLKSIGANVFGYALPPSGDESLFSELDLNSAYRTEYADIRDLENLKDYIEEIKPDFIFHLAAQSLVRLSYDVPVETMEVNAMGTVYLLDAIRQLNISTTVVCITTDKCYENKEWPYGYRETDALGGHDPYSASKGAAEILINCYRNSFFDPIAYSQHGVKLASARAGNVIGGGDWALDRIFPDCIRAIINDEQIFIRNPEATRPWQHVLEPLSGYLQLGAIMDACNDANMLKDICSGFNFGPELSSNRTVSELVNEIQKHWEDATYHISDDVASHEARLLHLSIDKARHHLSWHPVWDFEGTVDKTVAWYKTFYENPASIKEFTKSQINQFAENSSAIKK